MVLFCDQSENSEYFTDRKWLPDARPSALAPAWGLAEIAVLRRVGGGGSGVECVGGWVGGWVMGGLVFKKILPVEYERLTPGQHLSPGRVARGNRRAIATHAKSRASRRGRRRRRG